ncbi:MAG: Rab family GTPase [Candidatus Asgardarchaeia archaeon]
MNSKKLIFKLVLIGDGGVGKTSLKNRFLFNQFTEGYSMTIGVDFATKDVTIEYPEKNITFNVRYLISDLAGQERFEQVRGLFYNGAKGALAVFDLTRPESLYNLKKWIKELILNAGRVPFIVIGNKADLCSQPGYSCIKNLEIADFLAEIEEEYSFKIRFLKTSAKDGTNVARAFEIIGKILIDDYIKKGLLEVTQGN